MSIRNFRERSPIAIGILSILGIAGAVTFAFSMDKIPALQQVYEVKAEFSDAAGLNPENQVRVAGIKVGTVEAVELDGDHVDVTMEIDNGVEVPADATAEIKLATLLGTKFVHIDGTGGGPYLEPGDVIPLERTSIPYEIYQAANQGTGVLAELDGRLLNEMLSELAKVTRAAREEIGIALSGLNELGQGLNARDEELKQLLAGAEDLTDLLSDEGGEVVRLIDASNDVLASLAQQREELQSLLEATKQMAAEVTDLLRHNRGKLDSILVKLDRALKVLDRNVQHLDVALSYMGSSSRYFANVFRQGPWGDLYTCVLIVTLMCEQDE